MKIIIVGAGISGLSTYLQLRKYLPASEAEDITIYEKQAEPAAQFTQPIDDETALTSQVIVGGGLSVGPNGMRTIRNLSPELHTRIMRAGFPAKKFNFRTAGGWNLGSCQVWSKAEGEDEPEPTLMVAWKALWDVLKSEVPDGSVKTGRTVVEVKPDGTVVTVGNTGGQRLQTDKADLVIGCDGVNGVTRKCVVDPAEKIEPQFQGLMNAGGFMNSSALPNPYDRDDARVVMTFGSNGFFGYAPNTSSAQSLAQPGPRAMWWSTYTAATPTPLAPTNPTVLTKLRERHGDWTDPTISHALTHSTPDVFTPSWTMPPLPRWHRGVAVLLGDAAHALPSTSGQGISQALEDGATLAILVAAALDPVAAKEAVPDAAVDKTPYIYDAAQGNLRNRKPGTASSTTTSSPSAAALASAPWAERLATALTHYAGQRQPHVHKLLAETLARQPRKPQLSLLETLVLYLTLFFALRVLDPQARDSWHNAHDAVGEARETAARGRLLSPEEREERERERVERETAVAVKDWYRGGVKSAFSS